MLNTRNIRVLITVLVLFCVVGFFVTSKTSITNSNQQVRPAHSEPHLPNQGQQNNRPYVDTANNGKVIADKLQNNVPAGDKLADGELNVKAPAAKPQAGSGGSVAGSKESKSYVVMIDAGSSGSRVHIYEFDTSVSPPKLLNEVFERLKPGLSSFDTDAKGAAASLDKLLDAAVAAVPKDKQGCTPVAVKATAGLRKLGDEKANAILAEVRRHLETDYPFAVVDGDGISVMEGKDEGVYAWITTNYLLGNIGSSEKNPTAAVFDLGGGSTQIVFEPEFADDSQMIEGEHKYDLNFGDREFTLYQYSHLGYGLMEARNKMNSLVVASHLQKNTELGAMKYTDGKAAKAAAEEGKSSITLPNPCIPPKVTSENVVVEMSKDEFYVVNFHGPSTAAGAQCRFYAEKVLKKDSECTQKPCSFNGVHQPSLNRAFKKSNDMFVFSFFYDRTTPLGFPTSFTVEELHDLAKIVCNGEDYWNEVLLDDHIQKLKEEPQWCTDLSFISALIHNGYDIPLNRELRTAAKIDGNEIGWCLGASLPLLDPKSGWKCRVKAS
jgi:guanosine-diphosphatase